MKRTSTGQLLETPLSVIKEVNVKFSNHSRLENKKSGREKN